MRIHKFRFLIMQQKQSIFEMQIEKLFKIKNKPRKCSVVDLLNYKTNQGNIVQLIYSKICVVFFFFLLRILHINSHVGIPFSVLLSKITLENCSREGSGAPG